MVKGCSRERGKGQSRKALAKVPLPVLEIELLQLQHCLFANQLQELGAGHASNSRSSGWHLAFRDGQFQKHCTLVALQATILLSVETHDMPSPAFFPADYLTKALKVLVAQASLNCGSYLDTI